MCFLSCLFILRRSFVDLLYLLSADKSYSLDDESDKLGSDSRSSGIYCFCAFRCVFVILLVVLMFWGLTSLNQQESSPKVIFLFLTFFYQYESIPMVVDSSKCFGAQISCFISKFETLFYSYSHSQNSPCILQPL